MQYIKLLNLKTMVESYQAQTVVEILRTSPSYSNDFKELPGIYVKQKGGHVLIENMVQPKLLPMENELITEPVKIRKNESNASFKAST